MVTRIGKDGSTTSFRASIIGFKTAENYLDVRYVQRFIEFVNREDRVKVVWYRKICMKIAPGKSWKRWYSKMVCVPKHNVTKLIYKPDGNIYYASR